MEASHGIVVGRTIPNPEQTQLLVKPFARTVEDEGTRFFNTCNIFYLRHDLEAVGGFDETFSAHGGEDTDLAIRVRDNGVQPNYEPGALVFHDVHPGSFRRALKDTARWTGIPHVIARHPQLRSVLHWRTFWKRSHPLVILAVAGIALAPWQLPALVLVAPWVWYRIRVRPFCPGARRRVLALPGGFLLDLVEVVTMVRGSFRYRTVVL